MDWIKSLLITDETMKKGILRTKLIKIEETRKRELVRCTRCSAAIMEDQITWLVLSNTNGDYYPQDKFPGDHQTQGAFPFGRICAFMQLHEQDKSNNVDHIIIDSANKTATCQHCEAVLRGNENVPDNIFISMSEAFIGEHKNCPK